MASISKQLLETQRQNRERFRSDGFRLTDSEDWVELDSAAPSNRAGWNGTRVQAWRADAALVWWQSTSVCTAPIAAPASASCPATPHANCAGRSTRPRWRPAGRAVPTTPTTRPSRRAGSATRAPRWRSRATPTTCCTASDPPPWSASELTEPPDDHARDALRHARPSSKITLPASSRSSRGSHPSAVLAHKD